MKILQIGAYPPPFDGVSVHLMRLHDQLCRRGMDHTIIDLTDPPKNASGVVQMSWTEATAFLTDQPRSVVHFHNFKPALASDYARLARRHVCILSLHDERFEDELAALGPRCRQRAVSDLRRVPCVIVDNQRARRRASALWRECAEIHLIPEFIPPAEVPPLTHPGLLKLRRRCRFLLASNGSRIAFHDGCDLYGLDMLVELLRRLVHEHDIDAGLAFLLPNRGDTTYLNRMRERIRDFDLARRCLIVAEPLDESSSLWRESDVVIRATPTDGNSLTIFEALALGVPVVASDCVERPAGSVVFRTRDTDDLTARIIDVLSDLPAQRANLPRIAADGNLPAFLELYAGLERKWMHHES